MRFSQEENNNNNNNDSRLTVELRASSRNVWAMLGGCQPPKGGLQGTMGAETKWQSGKEEGEQNTLYQHLHPFAYGQQSGRDETSGAY